MIWMPDYWKNSDYTIEVVDDGGKAIEKLRQVPFAILLIDWMMPEWMVSL